MKTKKKVLTSVSWAPGTAPYDKSATGQCFKFMKRLDEGLRKQLLKQKSQFHPDYTSKLVGKNLLEWARAPWLSILLLITVERVYVVREKC